MNHIIVMILKILLLNLSCLIKCHPAPSMVLCHGLQLNVKYHYDYWTTLMLNNDDHTGKEPVTFGYKGPFQVENLWQDKSNYVIAVDFTSYSTGHYLDHDGKPVRGPGYGSTNQQSYPLIAHIINSNDNQMVKSFYRHNKESITTINLKKAIVFLLQTKKSNIENGNVSLIKKGQDIELSYSSKHDSIDPIMSPLIVDEWSISTSLGRDHTLVTESSGWQNVSLTSRLYDTAYSKLHSRFTLKLEREEKLAKSKLSGMANVAAVIESFGEGYVEDELLFQREHQTCHDCKSLASLEKEYEKHMVNDEMSSIPAAIAYLKLMDRVRSGGPGTSKLDIIKLLEERRNKRDILSSLLDIMAGARTDQSIGASIEFLNLPQNDDLDVTERFLSSLSVSCLTAAQSSSDISLSSLQFIISNLKGIIHLPKWKSPKLKWSTIMTLGTSLKAYNTLQINSYLDAHNRDIIKLMTTELGNCDDTDCRVSLLHAFGNTGNLQLSLKVLSQYAIDSKAKRESVSALKSIKDCLDHLNDRCTVNGTINSKDSSHNPFNCMRKFIGDNETWIKLKTLISHVIWNEKHESTGRIVATEIATSYLQDDSLVNSIVKEVENFDNFEMTTLMWNKALRNRRSVDNWALHSHRFNGSSASFHRVMGGTGTMNASYGITMELLNKARLLKESAFTFELESNTSKPQHILTVGLIARGLGSLAGDDGSAEEAEEATSAGMALKILGVQLRPYTFFSGKGELMGHVWSGTASEPVTAFDGNLLVSDHQTGHRLINGFVLEQQMRGVLSLELTGEIQISLWNRNSHSVVKARGSLLVQGSQSILTSDLTTRISQKFAFGGSSAMDLVTDAEFYKLPFKHCLQMHQPELIFRHNTRKYEQIDSDKMNARIHRRNYYIPAKSFAFHHDNNQMCALMNN